MPLLTVFADMGEPAAAAIDGLQTDD